MEWKDRIVIDMEVLAGKPRIKDTRIAVDFLLDLMANGWDLGTIQHNYPQITGEDLQASLAYASAMLKDEVILAVKK